MLHHLNIIKSHFIFKIIIFIEFIFIYLIINFMILYLKLDFINLHFNLIYLDVYLLNFILF